MAQKKKTMATEHQINTAAMIEQDIYIFQNFNDKSYNNNQIDKGFYNLNGNN